jgi:hypothetical protein
MANLFLQMEKHQHSTNLSTAQQANSNKRREKDVMKLLVSEYDVTIVNEKSNNEFIVKLKGPINSIYEGVIFCQFNILIRDLGTYE